MRVKLHYQFSEINGDKILGRYMETEYEDPIFLNMQFCIERNQFRKLMELCSEYKIEDIHQAINIILNDIDPEKIIELIECS